MEIDQTLAMMVGKTIVKASDAKPGVEHVLFETADGYIYAFYHDQDCCESVVVEDVCGNIRDLIGSPLLMAEEATNADAMTIDPFTNKECTVDYEDSQTWTFYKFATIRGSVTLRWLGQSNGYYSESVEIKVFQSGEKDSCGFLASAPLVLTDS